MFYMKVGARVLDGVNHLLPPIKEQTHEQKKVPYDQTL